MLAFTLPVFPIYLILYLQYPLFNSIAFFLPAAFWAYALYLFALPDRQNTLPRFKWSSLILYFMLFFSEILSRIVFWLSFSTLYYFFLDPYAVDPISFYPPNPFKIGIGFRVPPHLAGGSIELVVRLLFAAAVALAAFVSGVLSGIVVGWPLACLLLPEAAARRILPLYPEGRRNTLIPLLLTLAAIAILAMATRLMSV